MEKEHVSNSINSIRRLFKKDFELEDEIICPHCNVEGDGLIIDDYTGMHNREVLIECKNCDKLYKVYYKFDRIVKLCEG